MLIVETVGMFQQYDRLDHFIHNCRKHCKNSEVKICMSNEGLSHSSEIFLSHWVCQFANWQKRKGIRLWPLLFSNQISLVILRFLFTISGQTKFLIPNPVYILPCTFLFIIFIMDQPLQSNKISSN